jgi:hypothetical protein
LKLLSKYAVAAYEKSTSVHKPCKSGLQWYELIAQSILEKDSFSAPHIGQTQSSGTSSQAVPGATPLSSSPVAGS